MISLRADTRVYVALGDTDMRKGFDALAAIVSNTLNLDPLSGYLFLFANKRRDRLKILYWDHDGLTIWYRRLEQGSYQIPKPSEAATCIEMRSEDLMMLLRGIDYSNVKRRKRFTLSA